MAPEAGDAQDAIVSSSSASPSPEHDNIIQFKFAAKAGRISDACFNHDFDTLVRSASEEGGFLTDDLRQKACMSSHILPFSLSIEEICLDPSEILHERFRCTHAWSHGETGYLPQSH